MQSTQLSHYRILHSLGAGGMGEVWAAEDQNLGRQVAIKLLPADLARDPVRVSRFEREARVLAALNHPAIAAVYSFESAVPIAPRSDNEDGGPRGAAGETLPRHFLVMELVPGESLRSRMEASPLALVDVLAIARQLCEALEAAHAQGIVHRDLKPSNVMLDPQGRIKVLDFGLAKVLEPGDSSGGRRRSGDSPTLSYARTTDGLILGTAAYMSPEQATGKLVDRRTDIWAFGVILWEMLTGRQMFSGDSVTATLADVLKGPIDLDALPATTPPSLRVLVRRCLERDPHRRLHDIADARLVIEDLEDPEAGELEDVPVAAPASRSRRAALLAAAAFGGVLLGALGVKLLSSTSAGPTTPRPAMRFEIPIPDAATALPTLSPAGDRVAYASEGKLWIRALDRLEPVAVEGAEGAHAPFWSPEGQSLGFFADRALWRIPATGGSRALVTEVPPGSQNVGLWVSGDRILFTTGASGVLSVSARGGDQRTEVELLPEEVDFHYLAPFAIAGELLTVVHHREHEEYGNITVLRGSARFPLVSLPGEGIITPVLAGDWVLFQRMNSRAVAGIWAVPITVDPPAARGEPVLLAPYAGTPSVRGDTMVYAPDARAFVNELVWVSQSGEVLGSVGEPRAGMTPIFSLSLDRRSVAVVVADRVGSNLWTVDLTSGAFQRVSYSSGFTLGRPAWDPGGEHLYFWLSESTDDQRLVRKPADASTAVELVTTGDLDLALSPDGRRLAFSRSKPGFRQDLWLRDLETGAESVLSETPDWDVQPAFSPDGRLIAFVASGDIVVAALPDQGQRWVIASGGRCPLWSDDGRRLYYLEGDALIEVAIEPGPPFRSGQGVKRFSVRLPPGDVLDSPYAVVGDRFLMMRTAGKPPGLVVWQSWSRELRR